MKPTIRKASQRLIGLEGKCCESCGTGSNLQRHHPIYEASAVQILCQSCHAALHVAEGTWGNGPKDESKYIRDCVICGKTFQASHSKNGKTCSKDCLSELGRLNASKRWRLQAELTASRP